MDDAGVGAVGSVGGILFALPQSNLKRLLAFSSVENMGVVAIGIGLGALASRMPEYGPVAALCSAGAFAHILNHAFLKGALFLAAGSVFRQSGTLDQDRLGGLMRQMPKTGTLFAVNAFGLAGLPPMNGFLGELAFYIGAFTMVRSGAASASAAGGFATFALVVSAAAGFCFVALVALLLVLRRFACRHDATNIVSPGWDCGYGMPTARMAYTASAFTQPVADLFRPLLRTRKHVVPFTGSPAAPSDAAIATETDDLGLSGEGETV